MTTRFETKIAIAVRAGLEAWQQLNVTPSWPAASPPARLRYGQAYEDGSGNTYLELFGSGSGLRSEGQTLNEDWSPVRPGRTGKKNS